MIAHEVGHTLGLRHNFHGSTMLRPEELHDTQKTSESGQSGSIMDYNPLVFAGQGEKQGDFVTTTLGPYDYWAIEYAYKPIDGNESAELNHLASQAAEPKLSYATDEDALGTYSPTAIDPLVNQFDHSSDPLAFFARRLGLVHELWDSVEARLARPGEGYQVMRRAVSRGWNEYSRAVLIAAKFVGGVYHRRDHVGDPNGRAPYQPVRAAKQHEALEFLRANAFAGEAFRLPASLHNKLAVERLPTVLGLNELFGMARLDYPWHDQVLGLQRQVLERLLHAAVLARVQDNELRFAGDEKPFTMADLFAGVDGAIWSELEAGATSISSLRRNLQREHLKHLIRLTLRTYQAPEDATTLARASLTQIANKTRVLLANRAVTDPTTLAHLQQISARAAAALQAQMQQPSE